ncbi:hypothetical protein [Bradyrhizobium sp. STM 3843]|uniref:hypothetical protein n=1 Tax=Bradyrhizobium sp. STM 3843 TaxID=551947 RepID=UPI001FCC14CE|nr:hypothetical protein [Bradyrhizobium sp. STM 3843]
MRHPRIADLAVSFPALLFALAIPRRGFSPGPALARVTEGRSLAEVAAVARVPMWLRKLPPEAFTAPIARLPDGELFRRQIANHLPRSRKLAAGWLQVVADAADVADEHAAVWAAREFVRKPRQVKRARLRLLGLWTWFSRQPATLGHELIERPWTPGMGLPQALTAAGRWREMIELRLNLGSEPIADMWLQTGCIADYEFISLCSVAEIAEEAVAMKNCLRTFGEHVAHNRARLWSVRRQGERIATLRLGTSHGDPLPRVVELKGPSNAQVSRELWWVARRWLHMHDLSTIQLDRPSWGAVPLDRFSWLALWRPYWLAKQRIPDWLPIAPSRGALEAL